MIAIATAQGQLLHMGVLGFKDQRPGAGGKRGKIVRFSASSRRRLLRLTARLLVGKMRATFLTLTFSGVPDYESAKTAFKRFVMRLTRKFKAASAIWRMEKQKRGAIHFHLIVFNMDYWKQSQVQRAWEECTGEARSIVDIRLLRGTRQVFRYVSKYVAKVDAEEDLTSLECLSYRHAEGELSSGRWWGVIRRKMLPFAPVRIAVLTGREVIKSLSSFAWALMKSDNPYNSLSFHLFADNAYALLEWAKSLGGCDFDEWSYTVNDHIAHEECWEYYPDDVVSDGDKTDLRDTPKAIIKGRVAPQVQPLISAWVARRIKVSPSERIFPYFDECGKIVVKSGDYQEVYHANNVYQA